MIAASAFVKLSIDRYFATCHPERYEQQKRPYITCILIVIIWIYVAIIQVLRYTKVMPMDVMPILISAGSFLTIPVREIHEDEL